MNIETITKNGVKIAAINNPEPIITDSQSAIDLVMTVKYECGSKNIAINKESIVNGK